MSDTGRVLPTCTPAVTSASASPCNSASGWKTTIGANIGTAVDTECGVSLSYPNSQYFATMPGQLPIDANQNSGSIVVELNSGYSGGATINVGGKSVTIPTS